MNTQAITEQKAVTLRSFKGNHATGARRQEIKVSLREVVELLKHRSLLCEWEYIETLVKGAQLILELGDVRAFQLYVEMRDELELLGVDVVSE
jgi:hypothetical protein